MSQNVSQWLAEIQTLQRQVSELRQEREQAYASVDNWRKLYEAEAQQRRRDAEANTKKIEQLQQSMADQGAMYSTSDLDSGPSGSPVPEIREGHSVRQLRAELTAAKKQCQKLKALLEAEQTHHAQTRESLTAALGDAVDLLKKDRPQTENTDSSGTLNGGHETSASGGLNG